MNLIHKNSNFKIHFIGIGGIGMSGIAELMFELGYFVQGSDIYLNENIKRLKRKGIKIYLKQNKNNIKDISMAVYSSAIKNSNKEVIECKKLSIPLVSRADMLAELMRDKSAIAVAGSHGKTTTTSLVGTILEKAKLDPTIINGGIINSYYNNNKLGFGKWIVVEADESDGTFLKLPHEINIITNIDIEHLDYYKSKKNLLNAFENFINNIPFYGYAIICINDSNSKKLAKKIKSRKIITYTNLEHKADIKIKNIKQYIDNTSFTIIIKKNTIPNFSGIYEFKTNLLGTHNVLNATAAIIASMLVGASIKFIKKSLINFNGVQRRFSYLGTIKKSLIYDDYAHHPTEIEASYEIAKIISKKRIVVVFQPHRFSRTEHLYKKFIKILKKIDILYILDIYPAGEKPIKDINSKYLVKDLKKYKKNVFYLKDNSKIKKILSPYYEDENIIIFMGAGSVTNEAKKLIKNNV